MGNQYSYNLHTEDKNDEDTKEIRNFVYIIKNQEELYYIKKIEDFRNYIENIKNKYNNFFEYYDVFSYEHFYKDGNKYEIEDKIENFDLNKFLDIETSSLVYTFYKARRNNSFIYCYDEVLEDIKLYKVFDLPSKEVKVVDNLNKNKNEEYFKEESQDILKEEVGIENKNKKE